VQLPLYFADEAQWLATSRLLMGLPLYAGVLWITWLLVKAVYSPRQPAVAASVTNEQ
jgi:thiol:disulfide interchange protein